MKINPFAPPEKMEVTEKFIARERPSDKGSDKFVLMFLAANLLIVLVLVLFSLTIFFR